jgi:hypothetical protein
MKLADFMLSDDDDDNGDAKAFYHLPQVKADSEISSALASEMCSDLASILSMELRPTHLDRQAGDNIEKRRLIIISQLNDKSLFLGCHYFYTAFNLSHPCYP